MDNKRVNNRKEKGSILLTTLVLIIISIMTVSVVMFSLAENKLVTREVRYQWSSTDLENTEQLLMKDVSNYIKGVEVPIENIIVGEEIQKIVNEHTIWVTGSKEHNDNLRDILETRELYDNVVIHVTVNDITCETEEELKIEGINNYQSHDIIKSYCLQVDISRQIGEINSINKVTTYNQITTTFEEDMTEERLIVTSNELINRRLFINNRGE